MSKHYCLREWSERVVMRGQTRKNESENYLQPWIFFRFLSLHQGKERNNCKRSKPRNRGPEIIWIPDFYLVLYLDEQRKNKKNAAFLIADKIFPEDHLSNLAAENKQLKRTNTVLTIFLILVFIPQFIDHWSELFHWYRFKSHFIDPITNSYNPASENFRY